MKITTLAVLIFICYPCLLLAQPSISSFSPVSGKIGTAVTISGSGFSTTPSSNIVYFGKVKATVTSAASNSLTVTVPNGATYQPITVNVSNLIARSSKPFLVSFGASEALSSSAYSGHTTFTTASNPIYMAEGDLDNDGKTDVVTSNLGGNNISIFRNTSTKGSIGSSSFATKSDISCSNQADAINIDDIDGDGKLDLIVGIKNSNLISIFRNTSSVGSISFSSATSYSTGTEPYFIAVNDFDGDGKQDIVTSNRSSNNISIFQNASSSGTISLNTAFTLSAAGLPHGIVAEDIDMDGKPDISVTNYNSKNIHILRNIHSSGSLSSSSFASSVTVSTGTANPMGLAVKDIDMDGKNDLVCTYQSSGQLAIFRSTSSSGSISFASASTFTSGTTARSAYVNDMNGDGKPDIVCANIGSNNMAVFQNNSSSGSISLSSAYTFSTNSQPHMALAIDVDGDTKPEIVSCNYGANTVSVYRNSVINTEPTTAPASLSLSNMTGTTVDLSWTNGNGSKRIVLVRQSSAVNSTPVDETDYTANAAFGSGTQLGSGNYVVFSGSGSSVTITGLVTGQTYHFAVFEYNGADATSNFFTSSFGTANALLPVEFIHFNAALKQQTVELNWATASEINNHFFTIERSRDGMEFSPVAVVYSKAPNGNSNTILSYQTFDYTPEEGVTYYRIKQTDFDGTFAYGKCVAVTRSSQKAGDFVISPLPNDGSFTVTAKQDLNTPLEITIYNLTGQCVYQRTINGSSSATFVVNATGYLAAGTYLCRLTNQSVSENFRLVVQ